MSLVNRFRACLSQAKAHQSPVDFRASLNAVTACAALSTVLFTALPSVAQTITFGDVDALGFGYGAFDPFAGTTLVGLAPNASTIGAEFNHIFPFTPEVGEFGATDQIYVGSVQTDALDGYALEADRKNGPLTSVLDYSSLVPVNATVTSLTLGIAADDFQLPVFGQPFTATINGLPNAALTTLLNGFDHRFPQVQFFTLGLDPSLYVNGTRTLTVDIDQGGNGGDGFAVDFYTVGVTTTVVPEAGTFALFGVALAPVAIAIVRRRGVK